MYEYVSGELPGKIFAAMPYGSQLVLVGNLTGQPLHLNSGDVLFRDKSVVGFLLTIWLGKITAEEKAHAFKTVSDDLRDGGKIFGSQIVKEIKLENY